MKKALLSIIICLAIIVTGLPVAQAQVHTGKILLPKGKLVSYEMPGHSEIEFAQYMGSQYRLIPKFIVANVITYKLIVEHTIRFRDYSNTITDIIVRTGELFYVGKDGESAIRVAEKTRNFRGVAAIILSDGREYEYVDQ